MSEPLLLVPCSFCNGLAVTVRGVVGCFDGIEEACPECEGAGQTLVEGEPITLEDLEDAYG